MSDCQREPIGSFVLDSVVKIESPLFACLLVSTLQNSLIVVQAFFRGDGFVSIPTRRKIPLVVTAALYLSAALCPC